jgi:ABC-type branched-subunit amino acid transport system ATPase component/ABC-type branched-subunit amino acid transport system permease subunit
VTAGLVGAVIACLIGLPALRLRGLSLALTTLGFGVISTAWLFRQTWFFPQQQATVEGPYLAGFGRLSSQRSVYFAGLAVVVVTGIALRRLRRSTAGQMMLAARDNEASLASLGFSPVTVKVGLFAVSGFIAGTAGVVWVSAFRNVGPDSFPPALSIMVIAIPVIGGLGRFSGAILGALVFLTLPQLVADPLRTIIPVTVQLQLIMSGLGLLVTQIMYPDGLVAAARASWLRFLQRVARAVERQSEKTEGLLPPALETEGLTVAFGGIRAVQEVSLRVQRGEVVGVIGPNGAGKTTLFNLISGTLAGSSGVVRVFGRDVTHLGAEYRAHFGLVRTFQNGKLFPRLSVRDNIRLSLSRNEGFTPVGALLALPWTRARDRTLAREAVEIASEFGLADYLDTPLADLSTGTRRVCDLAVALAAKPGILLLDEPTAGLAQREVEAVAGLLQRTARQRDCAILVIEHDMSLIRAITERLYFLAEGRVVAEGASAVVLALPTVLESYLGGASAAEPLPVEPGVGDARPPLKAAAPRKPRATARQPRAREDYT